MYLDPKRTINGSYGEIRIADRFLAQVQSMEARIAIARKEVRIGGTRQTGFKATSTSGEGSISGFKVTSEWVKLIGAYQRNPRSFMPALTISMRLDDPEAFGAEEIELLGCKFWEVNLGFRVDELIEETIPFTFVNHNLISCIDGNLDEWASEGQDLCD